MIVPERPFSSDRTRSITAVAAFASLMHARERGDDARLRAAQERLAALDIYVRLDLHAAHPQEGGGDA